MPFLPKPRYFDEEIWGTDTWPILSAAYTGDIETATRLVDAAPEVIRAQFAYYEPLHFAVRGGSADMVKFLLDRGGNPKAEGWAGRLGDDTPIGKAKDRERNDIVAMLQTVADNCEPLPDRPEKAKSPELQLEMEFAGACGRGELEEVERMIPLVRDITARGLYEAFHHDEPAVVHRLLEAGADVNGHMPWACWFTPLMHCLRYSEPRWTLAQLLLDKGVPVDSTNGLGMTALHIVVLHGGPDAARWLLDRGADVNAMDTELCSTPLGWAARFGREDMARLLLERGADPSLPLAEAWARPRSWARREGHPELLAVLPQ